MKTKAFCFVAIVFATIIFVSCSKKDTISSPPPAANFSYSGAGLAPANVSFTNTSSNATSYSWDFGDNATSYQPNPSHTYTQGGVYTVKLTATGNGGSHTTSKTVNISNPSSVKITAIKVVQMPFTSANGGGWDNNSGPDVTYSLTDVNDNLVIESSTYFANVVAGNLPLSFPLDPLFQITNFATTYKVRLWDYDGDDFPANLDDFIGGYTFNLTEAARSGYPSTYTLYLSGNPVKIELSLQWQ